MLSLLSKITHFWTIFLFWYADPEYCQWYSIWQLQTIIQYILHTAAHVSFGSSWL